MRSRTLIAGKSSLPVRGDSFKRWSIHSSAVQRSHSKPSLSCASAFYTSSRAFIYGSTATGSIQQDCAKRRQWETTGSVTPSPPLSVLVKIPEAELMGYWYAERVRVKELALRPQGLVGLKYWQEFLQSWTRRPSENKFSFLGSPDSGGPAFSLKAFSLLNKAHMHLDGICFPQSWQIFWKRSLCPNQGDT